MSLLCEFVCRDTDTSVLTQCPSCYSHIHEEVEFIDEGLVQPEMELVEVTDSIIKGSKEVDIRILVKEMRPCPVPGLCTQSSPSRGPIPMRTFPSGPPHLYGLNTSGHTWVLRLFLGSYKSSSDTIRL